MLFSGFPVRLSIFVNANLIDTKQAVTFLDHELKSPDSVWLNKVNVYSSGLQSWSKEEKWL